MYSLEIAGRSDVHVLTKENRYDMEVLMMDCRFR